MSDFVCMDWDLQAIVRSSSITEASIDSAMARTLPESCFFSPLSSLQQDVNFKFPDVCETTTILDELEELYKPFYPQTILTTASTSISVPTEVNNKKPKKQRRQQQPKVSDHPAAAQPRRGRNQYKRVEQKVTAEGLACDKWAWRKYGQKPIKGSPYPRSYYRCSSSKGCLARKQVERSSTDPGIFIITYSAEHNHTHPTRRSSLAGSTRNKASSLKTRGSPDKNNQILLEPTTDETHLTTTAIEDEFVQKESIKIENGEGEGTELVMPDMIVSDELFSSLGDLESFLFDQYPEHNILDNSLFIDINNNDSVTLGGDCCC